MKYFTVALPDSGTRIWMFYTMSVHKNYFKKEKYGTESDYRTFKISKFC